MNITFKSVLKYTGIATAVALVGTVIYQLAKDAPLPEGTEELINDILNKE